MHSNPELPSDRRLNSWKEIARELGVSVRTAQSYERTRNLPVQRDGLRVSITQEALREWERGRFQGQPEEPAPARSRRFLIPVLIALAAVAAFASWLLRDLRFRAQPVNLLRVGATLTAVDEANRPVWRHTFPHELLADFRWTAPAIIRDIDGDGDKEVITLHPHVRRETEGWDLLCFSRAGAIRWRLAVTRKVSSALATFAPPYVLRDFAVFPSPDRDGTSWTAAVFVHHVMSPAVLKVVDSHGRSRGEFWQDGHLDAVRAADLDGDGISEILAAGIQEIPAQAVLLVFDSRNIRGVARVPDEKNARQLQDMERGTEKATVYFPRTPLNLASDPFNFSKTIDLIGDHIQVTVVEHLGGPEGYLLYKLDHALRVVGVAASASFESAALRRNRNLLTGIPLRPDFDALSRKVRVVRWH